MSATSDYWGTREVARKIFASLQCDKEPRSCEDFTVGGFYFICSDGNIVEHMYCDNDAEAIERFDDYLKAA